MSKKKLFIEGHNHYGRAYFGWQNHDSALYGLREGYINAANELVDIALKKGRKADIKTLDTYIFPIFYLYRHAIEISLKNIYYRFYGKTPKISNGGHDLKELWKKVNEEIINIFTKPEFIEEVKKNKERFVRYSIDDINMDEIREMIEEIYNLDEKSDVFRYLISQKGELYFTSSKFIDYSNMKEGMNYIYEVLDFIYHIVDEYLSS